MPFDKKNGIDYNLAIQWLKRVYLDLDLKKIAVCHLK